MREVKVIWRDAKSYANEWMDREAASQLEPELVGTKGYVICESDEKMVIGQSATEEASHNHMVIPKGCIVEIKEG